MNNTESAIGLTLDDAGDIFFKNGSLQIVKGADFTAQNIKERFSTVYGELIFNQFEGVNKNLIVNSQNLPEIKNILRTVINNTQTVKEVKTFELSKSIRTLRIDFEVSTVFEDTINGSIEI